MSLPAANRSRDPRVNKGLLVRPARKVIVGLMARLDRQGCTFELFARTAPRWHVPQLVAKPKFS